MENPAFMPPSSHFLLSLSPSSRFFSVEFSKSQDRVPIFLLFLFSFSISRQPTPPSRIFPSSLHLFLSLFFTSKISKVPTWDLGPYLLVFLTHPLTRIFSFTVGGGFFLLTLLLTVEFFQASRPHLPSFLSSISPQSFRSLLFHCLSFSLSLSPFTLVHASRIPNKLLSIGLSPLMNFLKS